MSQILEIPDTLYAVLKETAAASGLTPVEWIATRLPQTQQDKELRAEPATGPTTLADLFAGRVGHIHSGGRQRLSEECGKKFTDYLEEKRRAGHL